MRRPILFACLWMVASGVALAQERGKREVAPLPAPNLRRDVTPTPAPAAAPVAAQSSLTPELLLWQQELHRAQEPKQAVRRNAEFRAAQRMQRLASQEWYGISNARPTANVTPLMSTYSNTWVGNAHDPYRWRGGDGYQGTPIIYVR